jgi:hypothetical protein
MQVHRVKVGEGVMGEEERHPELAKDPVAPEQTVVTKVVLT